MPWYDFTFVFTNKIFLATHNMSGLLNKHNNKKALSVLNTTKFVLHILTISVKKINIQYSYHYLIASCLFCHSVNCESKFLI